MINLKKYFISKIKDLVLITLSENIDRFIDLHILKKIEAIRRISDCNISHNLSFGEYFNIDIEGIPKKILIADKVSFRSYCRFLVCNDGTLIINENVFFNNYCSINCLGKIEIGENTLFGENVKIYDHNHRYFKNDLNKLIVERNNFKIGEVKIGKNCWIGSNVTILQGVEIGDNVIIGANNFIYKSIQDNSIIKANTSFTLIPPQDNIKL